MQFKPRFVFWGYNSPFTFTMQKPHSKPQLEAIQILVSNQWEFTRTEVSPKAFQAKSQPGELKPWEDCNEGLRNMPWELSSKAIGWTSTPVWKKTRRPTQKGIFPSTEQSRAQNQQMKSGCSNYHMARTALLTLQRNPIKDETLSNFISFTFVTVVLLEILVPKNFN